jgi:polyribonucleotide nucleotidyltransferase
VLVTYVATEHRHVIDPNSKDVARSTLDLLLAGTRDAILITQGFCDFLTGMVE